VLNGNQAKLRQDQRSAKADMALIISHALPKDVETFTLIEGVWVAHPRCAVPVAIRTERYGGASDWFVLVYARVDNMQKVEREIDFTYPR
jgi:hypothetical protein